MGGFRKALSLSRWMKKVRHFLVESWRNALVAGAMKVANVSLFSSVGLMGWTVKCGQGLTFYCPSAV